MAASHSQEQQLKRVFGMVLLAYWLVSNCEDMQQRQPVRGCIYTNTCAGALSHSAVELKAIALSAHGY
jgi:hypothetical protein